MEMLLQRRPAIRFLLDMQSRQMPFVLNKGQSAFEQDLPPPVGLYFFCFPRIYFQFYQVLVFHLRFQCIFEQDLPVQLVQTQIRYLHIQV